MALAIPLQNSDAQKNTPPNDRLSLSDVVIKIRLPAYRYVVFE
jgi:hypothetical protein